MRILKQNIVINYVNSLVIDSPQPINLSYMWNFGSLLAIALLTQIVTGVLLAIHYVSTSELAFISVELIIRELWYGWLIRYVHANIASLFFVFVYLHISRALYYGSYKTPRVTPWSIGVIILILILGIAFLGYVLVFGQISYWGATVITNLLGVIPVVGSKLVYLIWGGYSVDNATISRFFALHYLLPFVLSGLAIIHMLTLHLHGSSNPLGLLAIDRISIAPYYLFKDLITIIAALWMLIILVSYIPNILNHSDNYIIANPIVTPSSIVPEWYILPFYAILRSIPNKLFGVLSILLALLILLILPVLDKNTTRGNRFNPIGRMIYWIFVLNFVMLGWLGSIHVESPYIELGQLCTLIYFGWFITIPFISMINNTLLSKLK